MARILLLLVCSASPLLAQLPMSGFYLVDNTLTGLPRTFSSLQSAADALKRNGVSGPVRFEVRTTGTPYAGFRIEPFAGASAANRVTFAGGNGRPVISGALPASLGGIGHTIELTQWAPSMPGGVGYPASGPMTVGTGPSFVTLENLEVTHGFGGGAGCLVAGGCVGLEIRNCEFHTADMGLYFHVCENTIVEDCEIRNISPSMPTGWTPFDAAITVESRGLNAIIRRNRIHDCDTRGIMIIDASLLASWGPTYPNTGVRIENNFLWRITGLPAWPLTCMAPVCIGGGIVVSDAPGALVAHNSIAMIAHPRATLALDAPGIRLAGNAAADAVINNVVQHAGAGPCIRMDSMSTGWPATLDGNLYDVAPTALVGALDTMPQHPLGTWSAALASSGFTAEAASLELPAGFRGPDDLHVDHLAFPCLFRGLADARITEDHDQEPRGFQLPCRGADEVAPRVLLDQVTPGAPIRLRIEELLPGAEHFTVLSGELCPGGPGTGPYLGLCATNFADLANQLFIPISAGLPFHFLAATPTEVFGPYALPPVTIEAVCFEVNLGGFGAVSAVSRLQIR